MLSSKKLFLFSLLILIGFLFGNLSKVYAASYEDDVVRLINVERQKQNLPSLNYSDKLFKASYDHNNLMYTCAKSTGTTCLLHQVTSQNEATLLNRIKSTGYNPQAVAENIAWGYQTPVSVVAGWMASSGHKANILGSYKDIGCDFLNALNGSYKGIYWTCDFGKSFSVSSSTPTPTVKPTFTPTPTIKISPTPTKIPTPTPTKTISLPTPTPGSASPTPAPGSTEWWCLYAKGTVFCP